MIMDKRKNVYIWTAFMAIFILALYLFNTNLQYTPPGDIETGIVYSKAVVTKVLSDDMGPDPDVPGIRIGKQQLELKILSGPQKGKITQAKNFVGRLNNIHAVKGTKLIVTSYDDFVTTAVINYSREDKLLILLLVFLSIVVFFGRIKGLKAIFSLAFTLVCVIFLFIPLVISGVNPVLAAIIISVLSTAVTLLSLNGWGTKTITAGISCIGCMLLAGGLSYGAGLVTRITTLNTHEAQDLLFVSQRTSLKIRDLLFAGIIIASLGAIMDTTMSIASAIAEIKELNPSLTEKQLFKSGMNVGRDVMGTMTNTLILAFTGSSINVLIMLFMYKLPFIQLINMDMLVIEVIHGLSGCIAVILSIPITSYLASKVFTKTKPETELRPAIQTEEPEPAL
ncbi:MAG: hypothetical protein BGN88_11190 [Clostridiales bacterium 43-6]|nr:MAG: hypothetical protein BGN88_11190 [Clostridiales bacterium 43-6]